MKILYTATVLSHICQFHLPHLKMLKDKGHEVHVAARNNLAEKNGLQLRFSDRFIEIPFERMPFHLRNLKAYRMLKRLIDAEGYDLIVCNTPVGGILTRLAARKARGKGTKVIYMAHGFHFCKGAPRKNWLVYYPLEKWMSRLCDAVITINEEDYQLARSRFPGRVEHIHGIGVDSERFHPVSREERSAMRRRAGLTDEDYVVLCTGELNDNKNQKTLISATAQLKDEIPNLKVLLAGNGPKEQELKDQIRAKDLEEVVRLLGYRTDLEQFVPMVDLVSSCSRREGLGLNIVEAMLCAKPIVASVNRGHRELVRDGESGFLVPPDDIDAYAEAIRVLFADRERAVQYGMAGYLAAKQYTVSSVKDELSSILDNVMNH